MKENVSPDGAWKSFHAVPCLLQYVSTGQYYGRTRHHGKLIRRSLGTDHFQSAKLRLPDFLRDSRAEIEASAVPNVEPGSPVTVQEAQTEYRNHLEADHSLSPQTVRYRKFCLKRLHKSWPELGARHVASLTELECKQWAAKLVLEIDAQFYNNILGTLRAILDAASKLHAQRGHATIQNAANGVSRVGVKLKKLKLPEKKEFERVLAIIAGAGAPQSLDCADFARFLAFSGCRLSEARRVTWADVDLKAGFLLVNSAKERRAADGDDCRKVPIIPPMRDLLDKLAASKPDAASRVCRVGEIEKSLTAACAKVKVSRITHHDLRHLFATRCIESGVDIPTVSRWLGHKDGGALAMKVYGHLRSAHSLEMARKVTF